MPTWPTIVVGRLSEEQAAGLLATAAEAEPSYAPVGLLLAPETGGADLCVERVVGSGSEAFARAVACFGSLDPQRAVAVVWPLGATATEPDRRRVYTRPGDHRRTDVRVHRMP